MLKRKVILFANTLWFLNRFKTSLILDLLERDYEVDVVYFRKGPIENIEKLNLTKYSIAQSAANVLPEPVGAQVSAFFPCISDNIVHNCHELN